MGPLSRVLTVMILGIALLAGLPGCSGGSDTTNTLPNNSGNLNVVLDYTAQRVVVDGEALDMRLPDNATTFTATLSNPVTGGIVATQSVQRAQGANSQIIQFTGIAVDTYLLTVTAFDAQGTNLGQYTQTVSVQATTQSIVVATVTPAPSPSASPSPTASPSPSPSPTASPSPSPSPDV